MNNNILLSYGCDMLLVKISKLIFILSFLVIPVEWQNIHAQGTNQEFEKLKVGDAQNLFSGLALSPDGKTLAVSSIQSYPLNIYDLETQTISNRFDVGNWYAGSRAEYSGAGNYIILNQLFYMDWAPNKDREVNFQILDAKSGKPVKMFENYNDVKISPDEKYALSLVGDEITFWNLENGKKEKQFTVADATNSLAISPDGSKIAVSHHPYPVDLKQNAMYIANKNNRTNLEKYKQQITVYDALSFKPLYTVDDFYDIVYKLSYSEDGNYLFIYSIPHSKLQTTADRKSYVSLVDGITGEPLRMAFPSLAVYEPDFKLSNNGKLFCISSLNGRFPELHLYDFETEEMIDRFQMGSRLFEKTNEKEFPTDGRISFVFLPDDNSILMTYGNRLIHWQIAQ